MSRVIDKYAEGFISYCSDEYPELTEEEVLSIWNNSRRELLSYIKNLNERYDDCRMESWGEDT